MGESKEKGAMQAEKNPLPWLRLTLALKAVGGKAIAGQEPRTDGQQSTPGGCCSPAVPVSAAKARSKAMIGMDMDCRGLIQDLHRPESRVRRVPGAGEGPHPTRGAPTPWDRAPWDAGQDARCTSTLKLIPPTGCYGSISVPEQPVLRIPKRWCPEGEAQPGWGQG